MNAATAQPAGEFVEGGSPGEANDVKQRFVRVGDELTDDTLSSCEVVTLTPELLTPR